MNSPTQPIETPATITSLSNPQIRDMLFGLNLKLPVYMEMREKLDSEIRTIQGEIARLSTWLSHKNGIAQPAQIAGPRNHQPQSLKLRSLLDLPIDAKAAKAERASKAAKAQWEGLSPYLRKKKIRIMREAKLAAQAARKAAQA